MVETIFLVGFGYHARRIYYPLLKEKKYNFVIIDVLTQKDSIEEFLVNESFKPIRTVLFKQFSEELREVPDYVKSELNNLIEEYEPGGIIISSDPLYHTQYAMWALKNNLSILMDKPISAHKNMSSDITKAEELNKDYENYLIAASIHDASRISDVDDPEHGERASKWFLDNLNLFDNLDSKDIEKISVSVKYHDVNYNLISSKVMSNFGKIINVLKCADALDRFRLPKESWFPKKELLKIDLPDELFELSKKFVYETEYLIVHSDMIPLDAITKIGFKLGLIA